MEIGILFAFLLLDKDVENTSIVQINLLERRDRLMLTVCCHILKQYLICL